MKKTMCVLLGVLLALLVGLTWAYAAPHVATEWHVIGGGGASLEQGTLHLRNTLGQPVVGRYNDASLCAGFWCRNIITYRVFVPLVLRSS